MSDEAIDLNNPPDTSTGTAGNVPNVPVEDAATAPAEQPVEPPAEPVEAPAEDAATAAPQEPAEQEIPDEEPAEAPAEDAPLDAPLDTEVWGDSGSDVGNSVLGILQNSGVSTEDAKALLYDAVQAGDVTQIDKAALADKVGKHAAEIILTGTKAFIAETAAKTAEAVKAVHAAAGSKDNWDKASAWASKNIPEDALAEYRPMIDHGGAQARFAVSEIIAAYNKAPQNSSISTTSTRVEATSTSPPARTAMSRAEYVAALDKAHRKGASNKEIATIQAARLLGRKQGL
ncbi:MAG: hypothetical protein P8P29_03150 [Flavobacteriaceae bacterium]|nr:hypothetical protein [Flavobacteriaceae bacterium]